MIEAANEPPSFISRLLEVWPVETWSAHRSVVAVSGGADSTALLCALSQLHRWTGHTPRLVVAHVNHGTRSEASDADQRFVEELAVQCRVDLHLKRFSPHDWSDAPEGFEQAAREARLKFFEQVAAEVGARYLLTAHTADDVAETLLFRLMRGTGVHGLASIPRYRALSDQLTLVRPWLQVRRRELLDYLQQIDQPFCQDQSNLSPQFTRNRIRHELLPLMQEVMGRDVTAALVRLAEQATDWSQALVILGQFADVSPSQASASLAANGLPRSVAADAGEQVWRLDRRGLASAVREPLVGWLRRWAESQGLGLRDWDTEAWRRLGNQILEGQPLVWTYPGALRVEVRGEELEIYRSGGVAGHAQQDRTISEG